MYHNGGTETGLIGERTTLKAPGNRHLDTITHGTAYCSIKAECTFENRDKSRSNHIKIENNDDKSTNHIDHSHKRNQLLGYRRHSLQSTHDYQGRKNQNTDSGNPGSDTEGTLHITGYGIYLAHITDTEGCQQTEAGE